MICKLAKSHSIQNLDQTIVLIHDTLKKFDNNLVNSFSYIQLQQKYKMLALFYFMLSLNLINNQIQFLILKENILKLRKIISFCKQLPGKFKDLDCIQLDFMEVEDIKENKEEETKEIKLEKFEQNFKEKETQIITVIKQIEFYHTNNKYILSLYEIPGSIDYVMQQKRHQATVMDIVDSLRQLEQLDPVKYKQYTEDNEWAYIYKVTYDNSYFGDMTWDAFLHS